MVKLDYNQARKVHKLIREECCNCIDGNCILLDDACVQLISQQYIYCNYFLRAVLPQDKSLHAELCLKDAKRCAVCGNHFAPRSNRQKYCDGCTNLAFIGQYVEVDGDVVFTIETSVRTPLEAVYKLTGLEKEPIELYPSKYDMRYYKERLFKFTGLSVSLTRKDLPRINIFKLLFNKNKVIDSVLEEINKIPPYYIMYPGRDKSVALKKSVLNPQYPKDSE